MNIETINIIKCNACNTKLYNNNNNNNMNTSDIMLKHLLDSSSCYKWTLVMEKDKHNANIIEFIIENLYKDVEEFKCICGSNFSNLGNYNKHMKNNLACQKLIYYNKFINEFNNNSLNLLKCEKIFKNEENESIINIFNYCSRSIPYDDNSTYYKNYPNKTCEYMKDLEWAYNVGINYLKNLTIRDTILVDCDGTLLYDNGDDMNFGDIFISLINEPIKRLIVEAKKMNFKIIVLSARPQESYESTKYNLDIFDIPYDQIFINKNKMDFSEFKKNIVDKLKETHNIILSIGDSDYDMFKPVAIKLPCQDDMCS